MGTEGVASDTETVELRTAVATLARSGKAPEGLKTRTKSRGKRTAVQKLLEAIEGKERRKFIDRLSNHSFVALQLI